MNTPKEILPELLLDLHHLDSKLEIVCKELINSYRGRINQIIDDYYKTRTLSEDSVMEAMRIKCCLDLIVDQFIQFSNGVEEDD